MQLVGTFSKCDQVRLSRVSVKFVRNSLGVLVGHIGLYQSVQVPVAAIVRSHQFFRIVIFVANVKGLFVVIGGRLVWILQC